MPRPVRPAAARRFAVQALAVCVVAVAAAVVAFVQGSWLGLVWLLLAAVTSNLAWYYHRRGRSPQGDRSGDAGSGDAGSGAADEPVPASGDGPPAAG